MFGLYLHIPFCAKACVYCNFHFSTLLKYKSAVISAMQQELVLHAKSSEFSQKKICSIYLGGGTPSLLDIEELAGLLDTIYQQYVVMENIELTMELNPEDVTRNMVAKWISLGINRFSLGVQSFCDTTLKFLGRAYDAKQALNALEILLESGSNISCDLILGATTKGAIPVMKSLELLVSYKVPHIAAYLLTVEPKTVLANWIFHKKITPLCEQSQKNDFLTCMRYLVNQGYEQYELSNYALPSYRAIHNSGYWHGTPYLGIGPGAHSYDGKNRRSWNVANNALYVQSLEENRLPETWEYLDERNLYNEYILNRLRLMEGINLTDLKQRFAPEYINYFYSQIDNLNRRWFCCENNTFALTEEGKLFADAVVLAMIY